MCFCVSQSDLTKQQNSFKITLKTLEDNLLSRLSAASGDFLGDTELVENLETTKRTAAEIEEKVLFFFYCYNTCDQNFSAPVSASDYRSEVSVQVFSGY